MKAMSDARARFSHRMAMHLRVEPFRLRNAMPMVSFTFDDVPKSAATVGAAVLDAHGVHGTFYVIGSQVGASSPLWDMVDGEDIVALHRHGHEIACHTFSHLRVIDLDAAEMTAEIERSRQYFSAIDPSIKIENFAYPYGAGAVSHKRRLGEAFRSSRGIVPGVNSGTVDLQYLRAVPLMEANIDRDGVDRAFDEAVADNGWLIFYSHDVADSPSPYGCSPAFLRHALDEASRRNMPILSVADALRSANPA
jgi:peptidoglycan/xylan/chitin deacetylase (PgdA/CDA1 family)